jgi:hypothetical protein
VLLALGLGAGLRNREVAHVVGLDVLVDDDGVQIRVGGSAARIVPVLRRWEAQVARMGAVAGSSAIWCAARGGTSYKAIGHFIDNCPRSDAPVLTVQRLRATWIAHHLRARTPLGVLKEAAGVGVEQLATYATSLPLPEPASARRMLRNATVE